MIKIIAERNDHLALPIVETALIRSCSESLVKSLPLDEAVQRIDEQSIWVLIQPGFELTKLFFKLKARPGNKIIILGKCDPEIKTQLSITDQENNINTKSMFDCAPASPNAPTSSAGAIVYKQGVFDINEESFVRYCSRYDYADEWNNLNYGAITADCSIWAISDYVSIPSQNELAAVKAHGEVVTSFLGLWCEKGTSILWCNRNVGTIDGPDWRVFENYIADFAPENLICAPVIDDIPHGYDLAVTSRLDCDEHIGSARKLFDEYRNAGVPFSLALTTKLLETHFDVNFVNDVLCSKGSILAHSHRHYPHWGGSYETALAEAKKSRHLIQSIINVTPRHVVAPFHHTPDFAIAAMKDVGFEGCVGGTMAGYPEFSLARGGKVSKTDIFIGHSQQCMLHGHTISVGTDPLKIFKFASSLAKASKSWFGYLDHPFSERYAYDWLSEESRCQLHMKFLKYLKNIPKTLFTNEDDAMDFLLGKQFLSFCSKEDRFKFVGTLGAHGLKYGWRWKKRTHVVL